MTWKCRTRTNRYQLSAFGRKLSTVGTLVLWASLGATAVHAELPQLPTGERALFTDDFVDNRHDWTNIQQSPPEPGNDAPVIGPDPLVETNADVWYPPNPGTGVQISLARPVAYTLTDTSMAIYIRSRTDGIHRTDGSRIELTMTQTGAPQKTFARLVIRPGGAVRPAARMPDGQSHTELMESYVKFASTATFRDFRLLLTQTDQGEDRKGRMTLEAFVYDPEASQYVLVGALVNHLVATQYPFDEIKLLACNARETDRSFVDSLVITSATVD